MTAYIQIPDGRHVTLGAYARAWRKVATLPPDTRVPGWDFVSRSAGGIRADMIDGMMDRINRHLPALSARSEETHAALRRIAHAINGRVRVYENQIPARFRSRLSHRIATAND
jgi:hypothetical protein